MKTLSLNKSALNRGFALIASISILSLLTLVSLALLSLATVSSESVTPQQHMQIAHANARLALSEALAALQTSMGPDRRISVPATVYDGHPHDPSSTFYDFGDDGDDGDDDQILHRHWVGALDSTDSLYRSGEATCLGKRHEHTEMSQFRRWLVSGEEAKKMESAFTGFAGESIVLVGSGTLGVDVQDNDERYVRAPMVALNGDGNQGGYAWWIGDNSLKATTRQQRPTAPTTLAERVAILTSGGAGDPTAVEGLSWLDMTVPDDIDHLKKIGFI